MKPPDESKNNRDHIEPQPDCVQNSSQDHSDESDSSNDSTKPAHLKNESGSEQILISAKTSNTNQPEEVSQLSAAKKPFFGKNFLILVFVIFIFLLLCLGFYLRSYLALIEILTLCGVVFVFLISNPFSRPLNFYDDRAESIVKQELTGKREIQSQTAETEKDKAFLIL